MELKTVQWAREEISAGDVEQQSVTALVQVGRTTLHVVYIDSSSGVRKIDVPMIEEKFMRPLLLRGQPYPVERMARLMIKTGRTLGITEGARDILNEAIKVEHVTFECRECGQLHDFSRGAEMCCFDEQIFTDDTEEV